jgi:hypothetical protein
VLVAVLRRWRTVRRFAHQNELRFPSHLDERVVIDSGRNSVRCYPNNRGIMIQDLPVHQNFSSIL